MIKVSKPILFGLVIAAVAIIFALELIQLVIAFQAFPSVFRSQVWSPIVSSVPPAITAIAAVVALLQLLIFLRASKAQEEINNLVTTYNGKMVQDTNAFGDALVKTIRNRLASEADFSSRDIVDYLDLGSEEGRKLAGLAIVQWLASGKPLYNGKATQYFDNVLALLDNPRRRFEHYHAKETMTSILPHLRNRPELKKKLCEHVNAYQRNDKSCEEKEWIPFKERVNRECC